MSVTQETVRLYWQHVWRYPKYVIYILCSIPATVLVNGYLPPLIVANVLNRLSRHDYQPRHVWASFGGDLVAYALLSLFGGLGWRFVDHFTFKLEGLVSRDLAQRMYRHLLDQSADFHSNHFSGSLVSQTNKVLSSYVRLADTTIFQVIPLIASIVFTVLILAKRAPTFVIVLLLFSVFYMTSAFFVTRKVRKLGAEHASAQSKETGYLADSITNVMAIKSFSGRVFENKQFDRITEYTRDKLLSVGHAHQNQNAYFGTVMTTISALTLTFAVVGALLFKANIATIFLMLNYTAGIVNQLFSFSNNALRNYNRSFGDSADMVKILHEEPEIQDPEKPEKLRMNKGAIAFRNVVFTHNGANDALFNDLNLTIAPGEKVGLIGHSGSGKSTFTRILLRFSDIDSGEILIDDQNIASVTQDDLRSSIAYVPQEPLLFHRTILDNIAYGKPGATKEDVIEAAREANAHEFISNLPQGYETLVGERGVKLSGGQRQRVAIARALLKNAPILVLDEATSALDSESEKLIQAALWRLMEGRTAIAIAHRLSTIQKMDRILVMDDGKIVEEGSHKDLIAKKNGTYARLWAHQSGGFMEDD
jgi:ATP-binding cassette subfamily B protein